MRERNGKRFKLKIQTIMITLKIEVRYDPVLLNGSTVAAHEFFKKLFSEVKGTKIKGLDINTSITRDESRDERMLIAKKAPLVIAWNVFKFYNIPFKELYSDTRKREVVNARQVTHWFVNNENIMKLSSTKAGELLGQKGHVTYLHSIKEISGQIEFNRKFRAEIEHLRCVIFG